VCNVILIHFNVDIITKSASVGFNKEMFISRMHGANIKKNCSTCFGHYNAHHLEPSEPTKAENTSTSTFIRKPEATTAV